MTEPVFQPLGIQPTDEQQRIMLARVRHLLIEANAGAAKTTTLALRIGQALLRGADPQRILVLTYTRPAVQALRERMAAVGLDREVVAALPVFTFDEYARRALRQIEGQAVPVLETPEQAAPQVLAAIDAVFDHAEEDPWRDELFQGHSRQAMVEGLLATMAWAKGRMLLEQLPEEWRPSPAQADALGLDYTTLRVWMACERRRLEAPGRDGVAAWRFAGDATHDLARLVGVAGVSLHEPPLAQGLGLVLVDEMHDTNRAMFEVLKAVLRANPRASFVGVGDRDQVIHTQAGAEAGFLGADFRQEIAPPQRLPLTTSYRFGGGLAQAAGLLARKAYAADAARTTTVELLPAETAQAQATWVARLAQQAREAGQAGQMRILVRQAAQSVRIEKALMDLGVAYVCTGFSSFLQRPEVSLLRGLWVAAGGTLEGLPTVAQRQRLLEALLLFSGARIDSPELAELDDDTARRRAAAEAARDPDTTRAFIDGHVLRSAVPAAQARLQAAIAWLRACGPAVRLQGLLEVLAPAELAARVLVRQDDRRQCVQNLQELVAMAEAEDLGTAAFFGLLDTLEQRQSARGRQGVVGLSDIESAKGLEFDHVVLPGLNKGEFLAGDTPQEARNLLYVAMTRARARLSVLYDPARPSAFLFDAGLLARA